MRFPKYLLHACDDYYREVAATTPVRPGVDYAQLSKRDRRRRVKFSLDRKARLLMSINRARLRAGFTGFWACAGVMWFTKGSRMWQIDRENRIPKLREAK